MADYIPTNARFVNPYHFIELVRQLEEKFIIKTGRLKVT